MDTYRPRRTRKKDLNPGLTFALRAIGGQNAMARAIGRKQASISEWANKTGRVSAEDAVKIEQATGVPAEAINPALAQFAEMRGLSVRPLPKAA